MKQKPRVTFICRTEMTYADLTLRDNDPKEYWYWIDDQCEEEIGPFDSKSDCRANYVVARVKDHFKIFSDAYTQGRADAAKIVETEIEAIQAIRGSTPGLGGVLQVLKDVFRNITEGK